MAALATKTEPQVLLKRHMKALLKTIVAITPPSQLSGGTFTDRMPNAADKARGENAIRVDTGITLEPMSHGELSAAQEFHGGASYAANQLKNKKGETYLTDTNHILWDMQAALRFHLAKRSKTSGRPPVASKRGADNRRIRIRDAGAHNNNVGRWKADDIALVPRDVFEAVRKELFKRVGWLAAGWNAAAGLVGLGMPPWIKRHGTKHGAAHLTSTANSVKISIINDVPFTDQVRGIQRRVQAALNYSTASLERQYRATLERLSRKAGFR